jgi:tripartite-type tricarboxylate transporter receptor subunit TctC
LLAAALLVGAAAAWPAQAQWKPEKPITVIVPWAAGGATDQVTRVTASELEGVLGQKIVVVNQPGASGSIGKKNAAEAPRDGYTWTAGAPKQLGTYKLLGLYDTALSDWHIFLTVTNVAVVSVNPNSPYKTFDDLLAALKAKPGQITVATAGASSSGHLAMEAIAQSTGLSYKHVTYDGGNPAVIAAVAGETEVTTQLATEQSEMLRAKRLRPLAVVAPAAIELAGVGRIESVRKWIPKAPDVSTHFGLIVPKGVPQPVIATLENAWRSKIAQLAALKKYADERGAIFDPAFGEEAHKKVWPTIQADAWMLHAAGRLKMSPADVGIAKP